MDNRQWAVDDGLAFLLKVSRLCGTAPVRFEKQFGKVVKFSRPYYVFGILLGLSVGIYYAIEILDVLNQSKNEVYNKYAETVSYNIFILNSNKIIQFLNFTLFLYFAIFTTFSNKIRLGKLFCCYSRISQIKKDIFFKEIKQSSGFKKWQIGLILLGLEMFSCIFIFSNPEIRTYIEMYLMILSLSFWITMILQFVVVTHYINSAFANINSTLEAILCDLSDSSGSDHTRNPIFCLESNNFNLYIPISSANRSIDVIGNIDAMYPNLNTRLAKFATIIEQLCKAYEKVSGVVRDMNNIESYNFCLYIFQCFLHIIWTIFNCIVMLLTDKDDLKKLSFEILWTVNNILKLLPLIEVCHRTRQTVAHTRVLLGQMMTMSVKASSMATATDAFYSRLMLSDVYFSVFDMCYLDRTTSFSILGCSATFLVIIFCLAN